MGRVMAASPIQSVIREVSKAAYQRDLRAVGFRRQGNHIHRRFNDLIHSFNFQASRLAAGEFTVNLLVTSEALYRYWTGRPLPANPATAFFPIQQRIGNLMPERQDRWWTIDTDQEILSRDVRHALLTYGLPFFDAFSSSEAILERLRADANIPGVSAGQAKLVRAMLAKERGNLQEAEQQIHAALEEAGSSGFRQTVLAVAHRLGMERLGMERPAT